MKYVVVKDTTHYRFAPNHMDAMSGGWVISGSELELLEKRFDTEKEARAEAWNVAADGTTNLRVGVGRTERQTCLCKVFSEEDLQRYPRLYRDQHWELWNSGTGREIRVG